MDPASQIPQGADLIPSVTSVDAKRLWCSEPPADPVSKVLDDDNNTSSWPAPVPPLDDENLLHEILLRLPPRPSSLPRASLVCKLWRSILSDPQFFGHFRKHHRKPPLLGFFDKEFGQAPIFTPVLDPPDRLPITSFALPQNLLGWNPWATIHVDISSFFGFRHGIALFVDPLRHKAVLWDPLTGVQHHVAFPPGFDNGKDDFIRNAAVLCSAGDEQHVHDDCHLNPFKLVFACNDPKHTKAFICIYESKYGVWGDIISTMTTNVISRYRPSVLVGNALCWLLHRGDILKFDFERMTLAVIEKPVDTHADDFDVDWSFQILRGEDNVLGLAILSRSELSIQLWTRKSNCDGVVSWVLQNTVQLDELFSRPLRSGAEKLVLMPGYDEDTNVIFLSLVSHDYMLQLESMQFRYIGRREYRSFRITYPYTNFCTAVRGPAGGDGGAENVNT